MNALLTELVEVKECNCTSSTRETHKWFCAGVPQQLVITCHNIKEKSETSESIYSARELVHTMVSQCIVGEDSWSLGLALKPLEGRGQNYRCWLSTPGNCSLWWVEKECCCTRGNKTVSMSVWWVWWLVIHRIYGQRQPCCLPFCTPCCQCTGFCDVQSVTGLGVPTYISDSRLCYGIIGLAGLCCTICNVSGIIWWSNR